MACTQTTFQGIYRKRLVICLPILLFTITANDSFQQAHTCRRLLSSFVHAHIGAHIFFSFVQLKSCILLWIPQMGGVCICFNLSLIAGISDISKSWVRNTLKPQIWSRINYDFNYDFSYRVYLYLFTGAELHLFCLQYSLTWYGNVLYYF